MPGPGRGSGLRHGAGEDDQPGCQAVGTDGEVIDRADELRPEWLEGKSVVGVTSGASAPEELVQRLVEFFRARGTEDISELDVIHEDVRFMLPKAIRQAIAAGA